MQLICELPKAADGFGAGYDRFLDLLRLLEKRPYFEPSWFSLETELWAQEPAFRKAHETWNKADERDRRNFSIGVLNSTAQSIDDYFFDVEYRWGALMPHQTQLVMGVRGPHPVYGTDISLFRETIAVIIAWQRPHHVSLAWPIYRDRHQPLDRKRRGIGWLGWVPFDLSARDVPEAAICERVAGGTFLASQRDVWFAAGPNVDAAAIARAQALELRLNALGVLPTFEELAVGGWGQAAP